MAVDVMQSYLTRHSYVDHPGLMPAFPKLMRFSTSGTIGCNAEGVDSYLGSSVYQDVLQPLGGRYMLYMVVRDRGGHPRGLLSLLRRESDRPFCEGDRQKLLQLDPYLRRAFSRPQLSAPTGQHLASEGMVILDEFGNSLYRDHAGKRLLWMASHEQIDSTALIHLDNSGQTPNMHRLQQRLKTVFDGLQAATPAWEHQNRWGRFLFKAKLLDGSGGKAIGVTVSHYIPQSLKAWQGLHRLDLAPRQQEVALLFSEGFTISEVAGALNISRNTANDYLSVIYQRLGIPPGRDSLQGVLLK